MSERHGRDGSLTVGGQRLSAKDVKPRLVYGLLLGASLAGVWVTHWGDSYPVRFLWWAIVVIAGLLVGGLYWRLVLFEADAFDDGDASQVVENRWRRIETAAVWALPLCGLVGYGLGELNPASGLGATALTVGLLCPPLVRSGLGTALAHRSSGRASGHSVALFAVSLVALAGFAWMETGASITDWIVRFAHVTAFGLWVGGATWHNFVILPTRRARPPVADTLKSQAKRFRRHLPVAVVVILATGLYQVTGLFGMTVAPLVGTVIGRLVVLKIAVLVVLTGLVVTGLLRAHR